MVIGVDAGALCVTDDRLKVGVYRVTKNALAALSRIDEKNHYRLYTFQAIEQGVVETFGGRAKVIVLPRPGWQRVWLPIELKRRAVDAFLGFSQALPSVSTLYDIGVVYDLGFLYHPDAYGTAANTLKLQTGWLVRRADHIITISQVTRADMIKAYGLSSGKVTVAYPGVDPKFSPAGEKHIGDHPYLLFVGSLNKAKDIPTLICTFGEFLNKKKMDSGSRAGMTNQLYDLYLIGGDYWPDREIQETIEKFHLGNRVIKLGVVPDGELPKYYRGATAFVTTALREGFCMPAAEAMACGTPVVALDRGALREVVGAGGIVAGTQLKFAQALVKMTDKNVRGVFVKKAIKQAGKFRWESFARQILDCIHHGTTTD